MKKTDLAAPRIDDNRDTYPVTLAHNSFITVVSGLSLSGKSLIVKMLEKCNMEIVGNNLQKDCSDSRVYDEELKTNCNNRSWLESAQGKAVKVASPLLKYMIPDKNFSYKVIFMLRTLDDILSAQRELASNAVKEADPVEENVCKQNHHKHLEEVRLWLEKHDNIQFMYINYNDLIDDPLAVAEEVSTFLGTELDTIRMSLTVDHTCPVTTE